MSKFKKLMTNLAMEMKFEEAQKIKEKIEVLEKSSEIILEKIKGLIYGF